MTYFYDEATSQVHGFEVVGGSAKAKVKGEGCWSLKLWKTLISRVIKDIAEQCKPDAVVQNGEEKWKKNPS